MTTVYCDTAGALTANCGLTVDLWMKPLLARIPGATEATVKCELQAAIHEFYYQSNAWREQIGPYLIKSNHDLVWLDPVDAYSKVVFMHSAWIQDPLRGRRDLRRLTKRDTSGKTGYPIYYQSADPSVLRLSPIPDEDLGRVLWVDVTLTPLPDATRFPNIAASHHFEAILEGALGRIFNMPNKPWSDPVLGMTYMRSARRRAVQFRDVADRNYGFTDPGWRFPPFA